jgi:hypothetical protein
MFHVCGAQEILNVTISSNFIFEEGKVLTLPLNLRPIAIIDAEPDPSNTIKFWNFDSSLEAGLPATGIGGIATNDNIWLNYTYRGSNFVNAKIYARSNQIVPGCDKFKL